MIASLATCNPKCVSRRAGSLRGIINLRASGPLGHTFVPCNNVGVTRRTYRACKCGMDSGVGSIFRGCRFGARGRNMFSVCAPRVGMTHRGGVLANLPSACKHKHVINSCEHITLCKVSTLVRKGRGSFTTYSHRNVEHCSFRLHRRVTSRVHTLGNVGIVTRSCKCSVSGPTGSTERTFR